MPRLLLFLLVVVALLAGCVIGDMGGESRMIGQPETLLVSRLGMPQHQMRAPSGATSDVYEARNFNGGQVVMCQVTYFVRDGIVVGWSEHGFAANCRGGGGQPY